MEGRGGGTECVPFSIVTLCVMKLTKKTYNPHELNRRWGKSRVR